MVETWKAMSASVRGTTHEDLGQPNQDAVRVAGSMEEGLLLAVADGHGSSRSFRSAQGAALAAEAAVEVLGGFVTEFGPTLPLRHVRGEFVRRWPAALVAAWRKAVAAEVAAHPFSPIDFAAFPEAPPVIVPGAELPTAAYLAYGTTLLVAAITPRYILYSQLGDGDILTVDAAGVVQRPLRRRHEFMANVTVSLCTRQAEKLFQVQTVSARRGLPALLILSTDGYANCFGHDEGFNQVGTDLLHYVRENGVDFVSEKLENWLHEASRNGSGDDITVGMAVRPRALLRGKVAA